MWELISSLAKPLIENGINYFSQQKTNRANTALAREMATRAERASNTAHQREIRDLYQAGLNPILSVTGGSGASTTSGTAVQQQSPRVDFGDVLATARSAQEIENLGVQNEAMKAGISQTQADTMLKNAMTLKTNEDAIVSHGTAKQIRENTLNTQHMRSKIDAEISSINAQSKAQRYRNFGLYNQARIDASSFGKTLDAADRFFSTVGNAANTVRSSSQARDVYRGYTAQGIVNQ